MKTTKTLTLIALLFLIFFTANTSWAGTKLSGDLVIFHAGSLSVPFKEISKAFNKIHPDVNILKESAGSRTCARKISDLKRPADIMASADYTVIDKLLIPDHASWNIKFASNEMALVFHHGSRESKNINSKNWYHILMKSNVAFGRANPNADPCGYRAVLTMKLAEKYYGKKGLAEKMMKKDTRYIRPKETDLLALLESGTIDYIFLYRSVAQQHGLDYILLPDQVNLKNSGLKDYYKSAKIKISGKKPGTFITKKGAPMVYGITIPKSAPNPVVAQAFIDFLLTADQGMAIMKQMGQPSVVPAKSETFSAIPSRLQRFATPQQ
ncbi:MAG: tungstate ABC transporter substrate-binding protein WtpA [Deltaproteobacteria bacterium]|nr:tungstate ABC transporter substrate-binding protein WtpA [Deltaproteobacteria bacterium]